MNSRGNNSTIATVAMIGGGAVLVWLLWRGRGKGKNGHGNGDLGGTRAPVQVWVRSEDRIELDGARSDLATVVARARAAGAAHVHVTGDARQGWYTKVVDALRAAGVEADVSR
jgi:hypothetical protein